MRPVDSSRAQPSEPTPTSQWPFIAATTPKDHLRIEREVDDHDHEVIGVVHSHTHSEPFPSPTDVGQAPDPAWHYIIVSLKREAPEMRCYRIVEGEISEEPIELVD
ncbi:MAG: peptidase [Actinobacteria bacterium]|nr:peptidase [Actinomycetota bacterium]